MGWISSVAIMQEVSERILHEKFIDEDHQVVRHRPVPCWMTGLLKIAKKDNRSWWHVYLDNFASGQVCASNESFTGGTQLHELAEEAWRDDHVVSSAKKRQSAVTEAQELGAWVDDTAGTIGGSPERFLKLIHSTLFVLGRSQLSKKLVQIIAGRWIHVLQFRRPGMCLLENTWKYISSKSFSAGLVYAVKRELLDCILATPLLHTNLRAGVSERITASDASQVGGAVGIARELTPVGADFFKSSITGSHGLKRIPCVIISLFNGVGGAFRAYDLLGLVPLALISFEIHPPANRVVSRRWPHAILLGDVKELDASMIRAWLIEYPEVEEFHLWAGFPCVDLSSAKANRQNLSGSQSSLFFEVIRVWNLLGAEVPKEIKVKVAVENVASMSKEACVEISEWMELKPFYLDSSDAVPMNRPRLSWCTEDLRLSLDGLTFEEGEFWDKVIAVHDYPKSSQWIREDWYWTGDGYSCLPTCMKAIPRTSPPPRLAGLDRCNQDDVLRWRADDMRFPPYQYREQFLFWNEKSNHWRLADSSERELLLGYGFEHTKPCFSASKVKQSRKQFEDERLSLLGDSFSLFSFVIPAAALTFKHLPRTSFGHVCERMGMAPGFAAPLRCRIPMCRALSYGFPQDDNGVTVQDMNKLLMTKVNHTGSDVRITTGEFFNHSAVCRQSVVADWWRWNISFGVRWQFHERINVQELRAILLSVKYQISHLQASHLRICHLTDSYVCMSVVSKGRSSSKRLGKVLKEINAYLLAFGLSLVIAHVDSVENPTDGASR